MALLEKQREISINESGLFSVENWFRNTVRFDPNKEVSFSVCYESYHNYCTQNLNSAPCSKRVFGMAIRVSMREWLETQKVLESRTKGLRFKGIKLNEITLDVHKGTNLTKTETGIQTFRF